MALYNAINTPRPLHHYRAAPPSARSFKVSCHQSSEAVPPSISTIDRRGVLLGLGGLYGVASQPATAAAAPKKPSELPNCHFSMSDAAVGYEFPPPSAMPLRVRPAAHLVDDEYVAKYREALRRMKSLPASDPRNFYTHAKNHYIPAHDNWLFLPWHRFYIYFYERILGSLIDDPTFALPYWNFDSPDAMSIPSLFLDPSSALHNPLRDPAHLPPALLDFWYVYEPKTPVSADEQRAANVKEIRKAFRQSLARAELFMGDPVSKDGDLGSAGRLDSIHKAIHQWVGPAEAPWMDMGNIHASTKDAIFYSLHGNLDRLWQLYRTFRGGGPDFSDEAWLDAPFKFHDENGRYVSVRVRDCLDPLKMGYTYQEVPIPWAGHQGPESPATFQVSRNLTEPGARPTEFGSGPMALDSAMRVAVARPPAAAAAARGNVERAAEVEVLHIEGIDVVPNGPARFDVYIAAGGRGYGEFAGSYVKPFRAHSAEEAEEAARRPKEGKRRKGSMKLGISSLLRDMDAEGAEGVVVTLVPTDGEITVGGVCIKLLPADRPLLL